MLQDLGELNISHSPQQGPKKAKQFKYIYKVKRYGWRGFNCHRNHE